MKVEFRTKQLRDCFLDIKVAQRKFGKVLADKFHLRVAEMHALERWDDWRTMPAWKCHPLKGSRQGEWAIRLDGFYRLIVTVSSYEIEVVIVEEVSKHYGD